MHGTLPRFLCSYAAKHTPDRSHCRWRRRSSDRFVFIVIAEAEFRCVASGRSAAFGGRRPLMMWTAPHHGIRVPKRGRWSATREGPSMKQFSRIGIDLGKNVFHSHALESEAGPAVARKLSRTGMRKYFASIAPCLIGMEACGSAHYWARELRAMGHDVRLMPPSYVKAYVKRGK